MLAQTKKEAFIRSSDCQSLSEGLAAFHHKPDDIVFKCRDEFAGYYSNSFRTVPAIGSAEYLHSEFKSLCKLFSILPDNVAEPIALVTGMDGSEIVGYTLAYVAGPTLNLIAEEAYKQRYGKQIERFSEGVDRLSAVLKRLHDAGHAHGDPESTNVIITGNEVKLIDPVEHENVRVAEAIDNKVLSDSFERVVELRKTARS